MSHLCRARDEKIASLYVSRSGYSSGDIAGGPQPQDMVKVGGKPCVRSDRLGETIIDLDETDGPALDIFNRASSVTYNLHHFLIIEHASGEFEQAPCWIMPGFGVNRTSFAIALQGHPKTVTRESVSP